MKFNASLETFLKKYSLTRTHLLGGGLLLLTGGLIGWGASALTRPASGKAAGPEELLDLDGADPLVFLQQAEDGRWADSNPALDRKITEQIMTSLEFKTLEEE
ncbi:MAG: hypothetical protein AAF492_24045, partial [Verrucomicrobiota bacterium]